MKWLNKMKLMLLAISVLGLIFFSQCTGLTESDNQYSGNADYTGNPDVTPLVKQGGGKLNDVEKADLLYMREEEKLARDIYIFLFKQWDMSIFAKIYPSEQNHMDALKNLIDKHNMTDIDPVVIQPEPGMFVNAKIQALYDDLEAKGVISETDALEVGVMVELIDIEDLEHFLERVDNPDIMNVYHKILEGSYFHLSSFESLLP